MQKGVRAKHLCPEADCVTKHMGGVDVRGFVNHLIGKHSYTPEEAKAAFKRAVGRDSLGVHPKKKHQVHPMTAEEVGPKSLHWWRVYGFNLAMSLTKGLKAEDYKGYPPMPVTEEERKAFLEGFDPILGAAKAATLERVKP